MSVSFSPYHLSHLTLANPIKIPTLCKCKKHALKQTVLVPTSHKCIHVVFGVVCNNASPSEWHSPWRPCGSNCDLSLHHDQTLLGSWVLSLNFINARYWNLGFSCLILGASSTNGGVIYLPNFSLGIKDLRAEFWHPDIFTSVSMLPWVENGKERLCLNFAKDI